MNSVKLSFACLLTVSTNLVFGAETSAMETLKPGEIVASGWMRKQLECSRDGLGGHLGEIEPDQMVLPYTTREFNPAKGARGLLAWCAEMGGEYPLAYGMLGYALNDRTMIDVTADRIRRAMALQEPDGYLGAFRPTDNRFEDYNPWGCHFFYDLMLLEYARTGERSILEAVRRGLLWFAHNWAGDRKTDYAAPSIIEPCAVVYRLTGDREILRFALDYADWLNRNGKERGKFASFPTGKHAMHVAAIGSRLKLPVALGWAADRPDYLKAARDFLDDYRNRVGWQATYAPCADGEWTAEPSCIGETEYCDFVFFHDTFGWFTRVTRESGYADAAERILFNGAQGARAKDERTIGYMTSPNEWYATKTSSRNGPEPFYGVYAPNCNAACCPANSVAIYPRHVLTAVLKDGDDLAVMHYGPYEVKTTMGGCKLAISSITDYPFDGRIRLRVAGGGWKGALRLRRPAWAESVSIERGGKAIAAVERGGMMALPGPWADSEEVVVSFGWRPQVKTVRDRDFTKTGLRTVEWGALVFSLPVEEVWKKTTRPKPTWGKDEAPPQPEDWPWFEVSCKQPPPSYAIPADLKPDEIAVKRVSGDAMPWRNSPIRLVVPMVRIPGPAQDGVHTPLPSLNASVSTQPREDVELVPYGATILRTTCFLPLFLPPAG